MPRYVLSSDAIRDLHDIRAYYMRAAGARVARHVLREIAAALDFLAETPGAGHARRDLTPEPVKFWQVFSYLIVYDPVMKPLGVARILHSSRDLTTLLTNHPPRPG